MSGSNNEITNTGGPVSSAEPSMEEILASIRRILKDEQTGPQDEEEEILVLDSSMVVKPGVDAASAFEPAAPEPEPPPEVYEAPFVAHSHAAFEPAAEEPPHLTSQLTDPDFPPVGNETFDLPSPETLERPEPAMVLTDTEVVGPTKEIFMSDDAQENVQPPYGIVSDSASNAAVSSIGSLIRSISSERSIAIGRPGLTLEDLVREELRPLLKSWLDSNLPQLVERIVRAEIQRVVERTGI